MKFKKILKFKLLSPDRFIWTKIFYNVKIVHV